MASRHSAYARYAVVFALTACALFLSLLLRRIVEPNFFLPFLGVVLVSAWFYGMVEGLVATALGTLVVAFFFAPLGTWMEAAKLVTFILSAFLVTYLVDALRRAKVKLAATLSSIGDAVIVIDCGGCITFLNPVAEGLVGWPLQEARKKHLLEVLRLTDEKSGDPMDPPIREVLDDGVSFQASHHKVLTSRDGHMVFVEESAAPVRDEHGRVAGAILVFRNITARREVQDQMTQSQKMEAIGRLAGGVAGDFNNLLTVITGYSEMLRSEMPAPDPLRTFAEEILHAADRAAGLTRQLLALSHGPAGQAKVLDLNAALNNMETMLSRLLGDAVDVVMLPGPGVGKVKADAAQLEQAIVNLAMNSRDAMPNGGKFVIETSNIEIGDARDDKRPGIPPGQYVAIAISDTGTGMDAETRAHLFEPFFTTKGKGKGTGLGLSIVYGIVQQSRGHINVYSQVGAGTIFEIYLPREKETAPAILPPLRSGIHRGSETILVADDEDGVRRLIHAVLATNGYNVLETRDGAEALAVYEANRAKIDMVVTDIVMPNMNGIELGERLYAHDPKLRVLYVSGYRDNPIEGSQPDRELIFLHKPFTPVALLAKVRELLDRPAFSRPTSP